MSRENEYALVDADKLRERRRQRQSSPDSDPVELKKQLLDHRFDAIGREHARARNRLALAVGFQRRDLDVQEPVGAGTEQRQSEGGRVVATLPMAGSEMNVVSPKCVTSSVVLLVRWGMERVST